jgi:glycosyltransferase involved in cell wall biosynthesis
MKLNIEKSVTVLTPCVGTAKVADAIASVQAQTYSNIQHVIVLDGGGFYNDLAKNVVPEVLPDNVILTSIPFNTGKNGFNGQRNYAAYPHLLDTDYVFFLDEDNWYEPDHVKSLVETIEEKGLDWAFSLRKIFNKNKDFVADDNCESLGKWPIFFTHDNPQYLIDTSAFAFKREFIKNTSHLWHSGAWGEDRRYLYAVKDHSRWDTNYKHTLCYRLDGNPKSVKEDFFYHGNEEQLIKYERKLPWLI